MEMNRILGMKSRFKNQMGSVAIAALVSLAILMSIGGMLARLMKTETDATVNFCDGIAAQYLAEAGLRRALVVLYNSNDPTGIAEQINRNGLIGGYRVTTSTEGTSLRVRSVGQVGAAKRSASALVKISLAPGPESPLTELTILNWGI